MKKTLLILFSFYTMYLSAQQSSSYLIKGNLTDSLFLNESVYLIEYDEESGKQNFIDTAKIENGHFELKGIVDKGFSLYTVSVSRFQSPVIIEPGEITISYNKNEVGEYIFSGGTPLNIRLYEKIIYPSYNFRLWQIL